MSSREEILAAIRQNTKQKFEYPAWELRAVTYADPVAHFGEALAQVGGKAIVLDKGADINDLIRKSYPQAKRIASVLPEITCATFNPDEVERAQDLDGTDVAVISGEFGVAENGAVWIPQTVRHKALYFIAECLVILIKRDQIVHNMQEAYERIKHEGDYRFGVFISGPSKTADIEQALVMGAHGARDVLVVLQ